MLQRDEAIVRAIHAERTAALSGPGAGSGRGVRSRPSTIRRAIGRAFVRFGVWLGADRAHQARPRPRVPSSA